jgi:hypothetical protein
MSLDLFIRLHSRLGQYLLREAGTRTALSLELCIRATTDRCFDVTEYSIFNSMKVPENKNLAAEGCDKKQPWIKVRGCLDCRLKGHLRATVNE